jgi:hypothetical protein
MRLGIVAAVVLVAVAIAAGLAGAPRAAAEPQVLACGQIRCQSNADCPPNCGPCVTWSNTCALFGPH